jgi:DNA-binding CsgD family transcriptional regulator
MTERQIHAAALVAQDRLSNPKIAQKIGISVRTLLTWKKRSDFKREVERQSKVIARAASESLIADKQYRMSKLESLAKDLEKIKRQRGAAANMQDVPGGKTGFVQIRVESYKVMVAVLDAAGKETGKFRSDVKFNRTHEFDATFFAAHQSLYQHIATETGDWKTRVDVKELTPKKALPEWLLEHLKSNSKPAGSTTPSPPSGSSTQT